MYASIEGCGKSALMRRLVAAKRLLANNLMYWPKMVDNREIMAC